MPPERKFYTWLRSGLHGFVLQRIETTTGAGIPDVFIETPKTYLWVELKANNHTNVQIRKAQYSWAFTRFQKTLQKTWVWNRAKDGTVTLWQFPFLVAKGREGYLKITSEPDFRASSIKEIQEILECHGTD